MSLHFDVTTGAEVLVPEAVDDAENGATRRDDHKVLALPRRALRRHVLILTPPEHRLVNRVEADGVGVRLPGDLVVLAGQVLHAAQLASHLVDVADFAHPANRKRSRWH